MARAHAAAAAERGQHDDHPPAVDTRRARRRSTRRADARGDQPAHRARQESDREGAVDDSIVRGRRGIKPRPTCRAALYGPPTFAGRPTAATRARLTFAGRPTATQSRPAVV